ncbi:MAG TPA: hypothetical protein VJC21_06005 [Candidatus Nanoarchaeia archaeon]|nr:hypothetical protein [Candidatus Nanoarchaeia archaeon]
MRAIKHFVEFIKNRIVKVQAPDRSRAYFLMQEAENSYALLQEKIQKIGLRPDTANDYIKSCYDILMELIRAKMLLAGYNASGQGAHEAEVSYLRVFGLPENEVQFADQLRFFRNGMLYYGTILDTEYAEKVIAFTKKMYRKLKKNDINLSKNTSP